MKILALAEGEFELEGTYICGLRKYVDATVQQESIKRHARTNREEVFPRERALARKISKIKKEKHKELRELLEEEMKLGEEVMREEFEAMFAAQAE